MKPIVYCSEYIAEIVAEDIYRGMRYICVNRGVYPCAYVICPESFLMDKRYQDDWGTVNIQVHGGVTYSGRANRLKGLEGYAPGCFCFGWDYGHCGDWVGYESDEMNILSGHTKYTTMDLVNECKNAIDQYHQIVGDDESESQDDKNKPLEERFRKEDYVITKFYHYTSTVFNVISQYDEIWHSSPVGDVYVKNLFDYFLDVADRYLRLKNKDEHLTFGNQNKVVIEITDIKSGKKVYLGRYDGVYSLGETVECESGNIKEFGISG